MMNLFNRAGRYRRRVAALTLLFGLAVSREPVPKPVDNQSVLSTSYSTIGVPGENYSIGPNPISTFCPDEPLKLIDSRQFVEDEIEEFHGLYGDELDTSIAWIHSQLCIPEIEWTAGAKESVAASVPWYNKRDMHFFGKNNHSKNYAVDEDINRYGNIIHEGEHLRQFQQSVVIETCEKLARDNVESCRGYNYDLTMFSNFDDYYIEERAAIIEDYARIFFRHAAPERLGNQSREALREVVENRFPKAAETRKIRAIEYEALGGPPSAFVRSLIPRI